MRVGAQAQLTAVRIDRQHHVMTAQPVRQRAHRGGQGSDGGVFIAMGTCQDQPAVAIGGRRGKPEQGRAQHAVAVALIRNLKFAASWSRV